MLAAEGQELSSQRSRPLGRILDALSIVPARIICGKSVNKHPAIAVDDGEQVVKVMGNPTRQPANGFHLL